MKNGLRFKNQTQLFHEINGKVNLDWLNLSKNAFKIACKLKGIILLLFAN
jgi:hypothetical protein